MSLRVKTTILLNLNLRDKIKLKLLNINLKWAPHFTFRKGKLLTQTRAQIERSSIETTIIFNDCLRNLVCTETFIAILPAYLIDEESSILI